MKDQMRSATVQEAEMIEISIPNIMGYERMAMDCSASFAKLLGFIHERIEDLKTAVAEACINAIEHGNERRDDSRVIIRMNIEDDSLVVAVIDQGIGVTKVVEEPSIEKMIEMQQPGRGFGIFMIKQLADDVEFINMGERGHSVRMVFKKSQ
jgi:serine/threonine-protein kinase RsbW